ncbi:MAG: hypothetical protein DWI02_07675 [Planctomycetota bacterium]|nr:MAG: hypothetical protein DWI02_07675 [Planctomycetota bacterium]
MERFPDDRQFDALRRNERDERSFCHDSGRGSRVNRSRGRRVSVGRHFRQRFRVNDFSSRQLGKSEDPRLGESYFLPG